MAYLYGSGHETVDRMANFAITGNVVPQTWYNKNIQTKTSGVYFIEENNSRVSTDSSRITCKCLPERSS